MRKFYSPLLISKIVHDRILNLYLGVKVDSTMQKYKGY